MPRKAQPKAAAKPEPVATPREADLSLLLEHLRLARHADLPFGHAWPIACESVAPKLPATERRNWFVVLVETRRPGSGHTSGVAPDFL